MICEHCECPATHKVTIMGVILMYLCQWHYTDYLNRKRTESELAYDKE